MCSIYFLCVFACNYMWYSYDMSIKLLKSFLLKSSEVQFENCLSGFYFFTMTHFTPLTKEEKKVRDSIVLDRLKKELEFFDVPFGAIQRIEEIQSEFLPYLKSEIKIENAIAVDCYQKLGDILFILKLLKNGK